MKTLSFLRLVLIVSVLSGMQISSFAQGNKEKSGNSKFEVKKVDAVKAVVIKSSVPTKEIGPKMGELYGKLFAYLGQKQIQPAGAPFAVYYEYDPKGNTTFECGVPVNSAITSEGEVVFKEFPAMSALTTLYVGAYEKMAPIYGELEKYMKEKSLQSTGICWEVYLTDPSKLKDPNENQTMIYFPVK